MLRQCRACQHHQSNGTGHAYPAQSKAIMDICHLVSPPTVSSVLGLFLFTRDEDNEKGQYRDDNGDPVKNVWDCLKSSACAKRWFWPIFGIAAVLWVSCFIFSIVFFRKASCAKPDSIGPCRYTFPAIFWVIVFIFAPLLIGGLLLYLLLYCLVVDPIASIWRCIQGRSRAKVSQSIETRSRFTSCCLAYIPAS